MLPAVCPRACAACCASLLRLCLPWKKRLCVSLLRAGALVVSRDGHYNQLVVVSPPRTRRDSASLPSPTLRAACCASVRRFLAGPFQPRTPAARRLYYGEPCALRCIASVARAACCVSARVLFCAALSLFVFACHLPPPAASAAHRRGANGSPRAAHQHSDRGVAAGCFFCRPRCYCVCARVVLRAARRCLLV